ncbi:MAG: hypothetical protein M3Y72_00945 [Acidobacteriota bacterium]|nr:hypothetical protein [Acidobacteriota bacterium]
MHDRQISEQQFRRDVHRIATYQTRPARLVSFFWVLVVLAAVALMCFARIAGYVLRHGLHEHLDRMVR